jgi:hypothetical protein
MRLIEERQQEAEANAQAVFTATGLPQQLTQHPPEGEN